MASSSFGFEQALAVLVAAVCVALLVRLVLGPQRRARLDRAFERLWVRTVQRLRAMRYWRSSRNQAQQVLHDAMQRARQQPSDAGRPRVQREGNVYTPDRFKGPVKGQEED
ncbi:hypothetical protein GTZ97_00780 [Aquabacterium fontiphilum]|jgi:hypothetical protein|uniref:hypothetical protein n=1 Tax=Aquabacterium fontiphilum TaxID=450365 RepID=UPI0013784291|nr:hypothetical protein [Aquabacterium fontiphilum]NBD19205.1 hypothetical protein [Aquabacterium fontiphilum]